MATVHRAAAAIVVCILLGFTYSLGPIPRKKKLSYILTVARSFVSLQAIVLKLEEEWLRGNGCAVSAMSHMP